MKRVYLFLAMALLSGLAFPLNSLAQQPTFTTICAIWKDPEAFAGKIVQLRAKVQTGFESSSIVDPDDDCKFGMWFAYAREKEDKENALDGRDVALQKQQPVFLSKDEGFSKFDTALDAHVYPREENSGCIGCSLYTVTATMTGRVDYAGKTELGFGHMNMARLRFTMASVTDVSTIEQTYDWTKWSPTPIRFPHGTIKGKISDSDGKPLHFARVEAVPPTGQVRISNPSDLSDDDGTFSLDVKPGKYVLVVNRTSPATKAVPMDATYYPSAENRKSAQIVVVADGQTVSGIDIHPLRALHAKHLRVRVVWPDGSPVGEANVMVSETEKPTSIAGDDDGGVRHTDKDGWATLLAFTGRSYRISADIYKKPGYVPYCEDVFSLPEDFRDGLEVTMVLRRQSETCRGQYSEEAKALPKASMPGH
jgi:hypothetical protein